MKRLKQLAGSPWAISFFSFVVTALILRPPGLTFV